MRSYSVGVLALGVLAGSLAAQDTGTIIKKVTDRYKTLEGFRIEGSYELSSGRSAEAGQLAGTSAKFLIESGPGGLKRHLDYKRPDFEMAIISNGSTTWTYLAKSKTYTKVEAAAKDDGGEQGDADTENQSESIAESLYGALTKHYATFDRYAKSTELVGDAEVKTADGKVTCWLLETRGSGFLERNWVDGNTFLVRKTELQVKRSDLSTRVTVTAKRFDLQAPADEDFVFTPHGKDKLVDELDIPGTNPIFVGRRAAEFNLKDLNGDRVKLSDLRGKVVVLDFWATWCPPCRHELPTINKLAEQLKDQNIVFLGINDEGSGTVKNFNKKNNYTFMTLEDSDGKVHQAYLARAIPDVFIIGKDGVIVKHFVGAREEPELLAGIQAASH